MKEKLLKLYKGGMKGRIMYVVPFVMAPYECKISRIGVELTDSEYVCVNMMIMCRVGDKALEKLGIIQNQFIKNKGKLVL